MPPHVVTIATEWKSTKGGVSVFNRRLCKALVDSGAEVTCYVPTASAEAREDARSLGVTLSTPIQIPNLISAEALLLPPQVPLSRPIDIVIGHGRFTGAAAWQLRQSLAPQACLLQFVHTAPSQIEFLKSSAHEAARKMTERQATESWLACNADLVVGVGPLLAREAKDQLRSALDDAPDVHTFNPGLDDPIRKLDVSPPQNYRVMIAARTEDFQLKGLDLAVIAVCDARRRLASSSIDSLTLEVMGAPPDEVNLVQSQLEALRTADITVQAFPYGPATALSACLARASLVLMPSRREGFGLSGLEAIANAVPVLISARSGLAELLRASSPDTEEVILPVTYKVDEDGRVWGAAISRVLADREHAFERAFRLRQRLADVLSWTASAGALLRYALDRSTNVEMMTQWEASAAPPTILASDAPALTPRLDRGSFLIGQSVRHLAWGDGRVIDTDGSGHVVVEFAEGRQVKLSAAAKALSQA